MASFCGQWVVLPLRGELPRCGGNDDFSGACRSITPGSTAGSRNTRLSWTSKRQVPDWQASSWRVDETYIRVGGRWCYLYRAITAGGQTLDFYLSSKRNVAAAKRFLAKAVRSNASAGYPRVINTDKAPFLARAIAELKSEGICPPTVEHRQVKYLNTILEGDHGRLKRILGPKGAFKNRTSAYRTLKGMEAMHSLRKGQGAMFANRQPNPDAVIVNRVFETA